MWHSSILTIAEVFTTSVTCMPRDLQFPTEIGIVPTFSSDLAFDDKNVLKPATQLVRSKINNKSTLTSGVITPLVGTGKTNEEKNLATLYLINHIAVKNKTADNLNDVLHNDVIMKVPDETAVPVSLFLLFIKDEDENVAVNLNDVAKDAENEGFVVEKVIRDGETRLVKVNLDSINIPEEIPYQSSNSKDISEQENKIQKFGQLASFRRKRNVCLKCTIVIKQKYPQSGHHGGYPGGYHNGYGGGCGGGYGCTHG